MLVDVIGVRVKNELQKICRNYRDPHGGVPGGGGPKRKKGGVGFFLNVVGSQKCPPWGVLQVPLRRVFTQKFAPENPYFSIGSYSCAVPC